MMKTMHSMRANFYILSKKVPPKFSNEIRGCSVCRFEFYSFGYRISKQIYYLMVLTTSLVAALLLNGKKYQNPNVRIDDRRVCLVG